MFTWYFTETPVHDWETAAKSDTARFGKFHRAMLEAGIWLPPSQFEAMFLGMAHGEGEVEATIAAAKEAFVELV
jgi:glutamate-1-semialdehyde 2,1-aminomutase